MSRSVAKFPSIFVSAVVVIAALLCGTSSARAGDDALALRHHTLPLASLGGQPPGCEGCARRVRHEHQFG